MFYKGAGWAPCGTDGVQCHVGCLTRIEVVCVVQSGTVEWQAAAPLTVAAALPGRCRQRLEGRDVGGGALDLSITTDLVGTGTGRLGRSSPAPRGLCRSKHMSAPPHPQTHRPGVSLRSHVPSVSDDVVCLTTSPPTPAPPRVSTPVHSGGLMQTGLCAHPHGSALLPTPRATGLAQRQ